MKRLALVVMAFVGSSLLSVVCKAATMPKVSTAENPVWYFVKFMNGGSVMEAKTSGAQVATAAQAGGDAQLWRLEGSSTAGYTFVSRSGMTLYTNTTALNGMFYAASKPASNTLFSIKAATLGGYTDGFTISPKANGGVFMNQWGGAGAGKQLGLWNSVDSNCPLQFQSIEEYEAELKLASLPLIPMPKEVTMKSGSAPVASFTTVAYPAEEYKPLAEQFAMLLGKVSGTTLSAKQDAAAGTGTVTLAIDAKITGEEAYRLTTGEDASAVITASTAHGLFNGLQTLRQLFYDAKYNNGGQMQLMDIADEPLFGYRGFMLDIARHYFDKEEVKKLLDVMALYKINKFHWHLTDDQGWRVDIPEYPLLVEVGAIRDKSETSAGTSPWFYDDTEYGRGMYYSLDDLREVVEYAQKLHIDIMPEIDLPGHMVAAVTSYPKELSCDPSKTYTVRVDQGISTDVLNVAKPEVMTFIKCVLGHIAEVFPYPVIHIGGDECPTTAWSSCKDIPAFLKANGLASVNDIQPWLVNELGKWLKEEYGKDVVCWNELTNHWNKSYETQPIIMCYSDYGQNAMKAATNLGLRTIYTGCWPFYLDMYQTYGNYQQAADHQFDEIYQGGYGNNTLQACYNATPLSNIAGKENLCLGVGGNLWTETCSSNAAAEHQYFPRVLAIAEVGWLPQQKKSWPSFRGRVQTHFNVLEELGVNYATYDKEELLPDLVGWEEEQEALRLLADAQPDKVGYPSAGEYEKLRAALATLQADRKTVTALSNAIATFKAAPVTQPDPNKTYRIISASVYYTQHYDGSALYLTDDGKNFRFHYTQQTEPEELFQFVPYNKDFRIQSRFNSRKRINLGTLNAKVTSSSLGTTMRMDAPTVASTSPVYYDYVPGMVILSAVNGYTTDGASSKRVNAQPDGYVYVKSDATVGHTGCWRIEEVTDYAAELRALIAKCERLGILTDELVNPASSLVAERDAAGQTISAEEYDVYAAIYAEYRGVEYIPTGVAQLSTPNSQLSTTYDLQGRPATASSGVVVSTNQKKLVK